MDSTLADVALPAAEVKPVETPDAPSEDQPLGWISSIMRGEGEAEAVVPLEPGFQIPGTRYQLIDWLGDGGMGVVYEAEHLDLQRRVALKVIREKYCRDENLKEMFRSEARAASRVGSEHITRIYDFAELSDGRLAFAMELLTGRLLKDEVR